MNSWAGRLLIRVTRHDQVSKISFSRRESAEKPSPSSPLAPVLFQGALHVRCEVTLAMRHDVVERDDELLEGLALQRERGGPRSRAPRSRVGARPGRGKNNQAACGVSTRRISRVAAIPLWPGKKMSMRTTSGLRARTSAIASRAVAASPTTEIWGRRTASRQRIASRSSG